ncbi:hypothetical protein [Marinilactibacillus psychrotolerans]|uniref:Histidine kinase N-terminal 7TM region domain-containing protein n=1 Tax=Marinilactibacillus psychrotolerans TaxID=191770 RepID=A0AAV3WQP5_9LACT|nr:hypothetical protein [Marinilactibacillus psychrotolerans]GEL66843.1 hypothetical protein MPS01_09980 [Marinilactibacillus psychrotolerans]GEQ35710.1 hypothetical protein M132T_12180 [Marinilactibacillus psychrotolerans]SDC36712.1 hypothetical protein SAMN04488013_104142 [Marinilactibacillus psychrotolerans]
MFVYYPSFAVLTGIIYVGIVYLLVRKEKKSIFYSLVTLAIFLQGTFLVIWLGWIALIKSSGNNEFPTIDHFSAFVDISYYPLMIAFLTIITWFGSKLILSQNQFPFLKIVFMFFFIPALFGVFLLAQPIYSALYYGFAP